MRKKRSKINVILPVHNEEPAEVLVARDLLGSLSHTVHIVPSIVDTEPQDQINAAEDNVITEDSILPEVPHEVERTTYHVLDIVPSTVTFRDPDSARRSVMNQNPLIDGRRANCNIAALGHSRSSTQRGRNQEAGRSYLAPPQSTGQPYARVPQFIYPTPYGYITYASEYGYQQGSYHPQPASQYYHQMTYGSHVQSNGGASTYPYHHQHPLMNYMVQSSRAGFAPSMMQAHAHYQPYEKDQTAGMDIEGSFFPQSSLPRGFKLQPPPQKDQTAGMDIEGSFFPQSSLPRGFKLQPPPHAKKSLAITDSDAPKPSLTGGNNESSDV